MREAALPGLISPLAQADDLSQPVLHIAAVYVPLAILACIVIACFVAPAVLAIASPTGGNVLDCGLPPFSPGHLLGTDQNGNDLLARLLYGGRVSLSIAAIVNVVGILLGGTLGVSSAYLRGFADQLLMRALDVLIAFPSLVLVLAMAEALGRTKASTTVALLLFSIPAFARVSRSATLRLRDRTFLMAARLAGTSHARILVFHLAPLVLPQLVAFALLGMGVVILIEGGLSFLGLGVQPPEASWGNMIALGQQSLAIRPYLLVLPGTALFLTVLALNLLGERLRQRWSAR